MIQDIFVKFCNSVRIIELGTNVPFCEVTATLDL